MVELLEDIENLDGDLMSNSDDEIRDVVCLLLIQLRTYQAENDANCFRFLKEPVTLHLSEPVLSIDNNPIIDFLHMFLKWLDQEK